MSKPIFIRQNEVLIRIQPEQIAYLVTEKDHIKMAMIDNSFFMVSATLSNALKKLPKDMFIRSHRFYVVSLLHIKGIFKDNVVVLDQSIPVGQQYYQSLKSRGHFIVIDGYRYDA